MNRLGEWLTKHRNAFLLTLLITTLAVSGYAHRQQLMDSVTTVSIPVTEVAAQPVSALEAYRQQRDQTALADLASLEKLCAQQSLDASTREAAAAQLQAMIADRQGQSALEGALAGSSLAPCVAVVSNGSVTIVTGKTDITEKDSVLVMTLAAAHVGAAPENIRIITTK